MGYEVTFHFYEKKEDGRGYDVESPKTFPKNLGKMEDVPLEKLASLIMKQFARRDVMIFDVEIYEFAKKKISFKETKGGILIKNKKFMLDGTVESIEEVLELEESPEPIVPPPVRKVPVVMNERPERWEIYNPDPTLFSAMSKTYQLTPRKKYPIYREENGMQMINKQEMPIVKYVVVDDTGNRVSVPFHCFSPIPIGLSTEQISQPEQNLMYQGNNLDKDMPQLRRGF